MSLVLLTGHREEALLKCNMMLAYQVTYVCINVCIYVCMYVCIFLRIQIMYEHVKDLHIRALSIDYELSKLVLERLPSADRKTPGHITPEDRHNRMRAIDVRA